MDIDWGKAPEGATHFCGGTWYREAIGEFYYWSPSTIEWHTTPYKSPENFSWWSESVARPNTWTGEGLPPVGTVCEAGIPHVGGPNDENRSVIWIEGQVIAYHTIKGKTYAWFAEGDGFYPPGVFEFRPIRTPEQIAAEVRQAEINEMINSSMEGHNAITIAQASIVCEILHKAGYRKQPTDQ